MTKAAPWPFKNCVVFISELKTKNVQHTWSLFDNGINLLGMGFFPFAMSLITVTQRLIVCYFVV